MNLFKKGICLAITLLVLILPLSVAAVETDVQYKLTIKSTIDGTNRTGTKFEFTVKCFVFDDSGEHDEPLSTDKFTLDTSLETSHDYLLDAQKIQTGGYAYQFTLTSCDNKLLVLDERVFTIYLKEGMISTVDSTVEGEELDEDLDDGFHALVEFKNSTAAPVNVTASSDTITKVYDGKLTATITDKYYALSGINQGHDVKLTYGKAEYNTADVKTANKVVVSELSLIGADASKYKLTVDKLEYSATITPRPITVTANSPVITLGQPEPELTYTLSEDLVEGNEVVGSLTRAAGNEIGEYTITRGTLSFGDNYEVTFVDGKLTISNYTFTEKEDKTTGIKISGFFDTNSTLNIIALPSDSDLYPTLFSAGSWGEFVSAYDVKLSTSVVDGTLTVIFPVDASFNGKSLAIYRLASNGAVTCNKTTAINGLVTVSADECGPFMLVAEKEKVKDDGPSIFMILLKAILIILAIIVGLILLIALFLFGMIFFNKTEQLKRIIKAIRRIFRK